jgi:hypothetical protein
VIGADDLTAIARSLETGEHMGEGGTDIDGWLAARGITEFDKFLRGELPLMTARAYAAGADTLDLLRKSTALHMFFIGVEAGRRSVREGT